MDVNLPGDNQGGETEHSQQHKARHFHVEILKGSRMFYPPCKVLECSILRVKMLPTEHREREIGIDYVKHLKIFFYLFNSIFLKKL